MSTCIHYISIRALLIASLAQGATPDAGDLASVKGFILLMNLLCDSKFVDELDGGLGQYSQPVGREMKSITLSREHLLPYRPFVPNEPRAQATAAHSLEFASLPGMIIRDGGVIYSLCRLIC
jgi:hypothetical protein